MKERTFETIVIRPSWKYYALNMGWLALLSMVLLFIGGMDGVIFHLPLYVASGVIGAFALYQFLYLKKIIFFVTNEQLIVQRGVFLRTWDYIELYRIIDFTEHQDLLQQLIGRKIWLHRKEVSPVPFTPEKAMRATAEAAMQSAISQVSTFLRLT